MRIGKNTDRVDKKSSKTKIFVISTISVSGEGYGLQYIKLGSFFDFFCRQGPMEKEKIKTIEWQDFEEKLGTFLIHF